MTVILVMEGMLQNAGMLTARAEEAAGSGTAQSDIDVTRFDGYEEGAYAEWMSVTGADGYLVYGRARLIPKEIRPAQWQR